MKTPHAMELYIIEEKGLNPDTGERDKRVEILGEFPCLFTWVKEAKVFEEYGDRTERIAIARFNSEPPRFTHANFNGHYLVKIETIDIPIKSAVRLKEVSYNDVFSN